MKFDIKEPGSAHIFVLIVHEDGRSWSKRSFMKRLAGDVHDSHYAIAKTGKELLRDIAVELGGM